MATAAAGSSSGSAGNGVVGPTSQEPKSGMQLAPIENGELAGSMASDDTSSVRSWSTRTFSRVEAGSVRGSIFSLCCSAIGMGVMVLPYNMAQVGPLCALLLLGFAGAACLLSLRICCAGMHATRSRSYVETLTILFSEGFAAMLTAMLVVACFGLCCGYFVFSSQLMLQLLQVSGAPEFFCQRSVLIVLSACAMFPLALYRNLSDFRHLTLVSLAGLTYLTGLVILRTPSYFGDVQLESGWWWRVREPTDMLKCMSLCFAAYTVHMNVFACYDELTNPTPARINKVLKRSMWLQSVLYVSIAVCGFLSFGANTPDNILRAYDLHDPFANVGRVFVSFQLLLAVPLTVHPGRTYLWPLLCMAREASERRRRLRRGPADPNPLAAERAEASQPGGRQAAGGSSEAASEPRPIPPAPRTTHLLITLGFVALSALVAAKVESASDLLGGVGGFAGVTYAFLLPAEMVVKLRASASTIDWGTSPAPFVMGKAGPAVVAGLRLCCLLGYIAAAQCTWRMMRGE